jgi:hypothetical protein
VPTEKFDPALFDKVELELFVGAAQKIFPGFESEIGFLNINLKIKFVKKIVKKSSKNC